MCYNRGAEEVKIKLIVTAKESEQSGDSDTLLATVGLHKSMSFRLTQNSMRCCSQCTKIRRTPSSLKYSVSCSACLGEVQASPDLDKPHTIMDWIMLLVTELCLSCYLIRLQIALATNTFLAILIIIWHLILYREHFPQKQDHLIQSTLLISGDRGLCCTIYLLPSRHTVLIDRWSPLGAVFS